MSDAFTNEGFRVVAEIRGAHPTLPNYPLLPGDLIVRDDDGTWGKEAPGLAVNGFILTPAQEAELEAVRFACHGLSYSVEAQ